MAVFLLVSLETNQKTGILKNRGVCFGAEAAVPRLPGREQHRQVPVAGGDRFQGRALSSELGSEAMLWTSSCT